MPEDRSADRTAGEADEVGPECRQGGGERILLWKEQLADDQSSRGAVDEEVVPFDGGADGRGDDGLAQLGGVLGCGQRVGHCPLQTLPCSFLRASARQQAAVET
jgi:hypothetical protein